MFITAATALWGGRRLAAIRMWQVTINAWKLAAHTGHARRLCQARPMRTAKSTNSIAIAPQRGKFTKLSWLVILTARKTIA